MPELVHIVDDDQRVRASLSHFLSNRGYQTEIYAGGEEFFRDSHLKRGLILLDLCMPMMSGHDVLIELAGRGSVLPVVAMSMGGDISAAVRAMKLGAVDFVGKPVEQENLLEALSQASACFEQGDTHRQAQVAAAARVDRLTTRQRQILQGMLDGLCNKKIAHRLGLCSRTVEMHRARMKVTLEVRSVAETIRLAIDAKMVPVQARRAGEANLPFIPSVPGIFLSHLPV